MTSASLARRGLTPADLTITPRDRRFGRDEATPRWWHGGNPYRTAFFNALSATFPKGEAFFVESVRQFRDVEDQRLADEIRAFTKQEVIHSREHLAFNRRAADAGYDLSLLEKRVEDRLAITKSRPPIASLAATMALEHFTAILAHELLKDSRHLKGADAESAALWRWHAAEEIEHKGVAYDTWLEATKHWPRGKRWKVKAKVMLFVTRNFIVDRTAGALELLRQDGITGARAWAPLLWEMWGRPGVMRKIFSAWVQFFMPGFHPWQEDDRALIKGFESDYQFRQEPPRKVRTAA
ncbi:metal-dependent hydrolase [Sphingomonas ginkgonis]|uniref:Metal-dependent hydrolase n=1 Tax=Sphingomonas ginkgonis TaxID=2315330 RepID=A0A429VBV0_9SPHN|nr:metal-dependent hydrolase [Sphingomonas ginkgonis]RST31361.1 metal-dependent hydrolase [Sphingomonas ginkgonis]